MFQVGFTKMIFETFRFEDENDYTSTRFDLKFFASSQNIDFQESFILPFFTRKVSTVILSECCEGGYALMIKLVTFDILFSPPRHSRENS